MAYGRGQTFVVKHWFHLLLVPMLLLGFLTCAYCLAVEPKSLDISAQMMGAGVNLMFLTVGWHYSKQAFGCMMVYAAYDRYPLDRVQRESLRFSLLSVWWYNFAHSSQILVLDADGVVKATVEDINGDLTPLVRALDPQRK